MNIENEKQSTTPINWYYLLQFEGDPRFRLHAKQARKNGVKAECTPAGWIYQRNEDADEVEKRNAKGKRREGR